MIPENYFKNGLAAIKKKKKKGGGGGGENWVFKRGGFLGKFFK